MIVIVVIIIIAAVSSGSADYDYTAPAATVSADEMIADYKDNSSSADEKYSNQVVAVTGKINSIQDSYAIMEAYDDDYWLYYIDIYMQDDEDLKSFSTGDSITAVGVCKSTDIVGDIKLEDCIIDDGFAIIPDYDSAIKVDCAEFIKAYTANQVSADETYKGNVVELTGYAYSVGDDCVYMTADEDSYDQIEIYFEDDDDLKSVKEDEMVTIVGVSYGAGEFYCAKICRAVLK